MNRSTASLSAAALVLVACGFTGGIWWARREPPPRAVTRHLTPEPSGDSGQEFDPIDPRMARVSDERQQATGVRIGRARRVAGLRILRTTGRVSPCEDAVYPIVAGASGWIREVRAATSGSHVARGDVLASFYAPELTSVQQSYYAALETLDRAEARQLVDFDRSRLVEGVERIANTLRDLGVSETQLAAMAKRRRMVPDIQVTSPVNGFVLRRNASAGLRFDRGFEFYRIADLSRVWILADIDQDQAAFVRPAASARVTTHLPPRALPATVSTAEPIFDQATLTLKVRLELANPGYALKPGMFVDVEFPVHLPDALVVPAEAVVDSGLRKTVFVDRGSGYFEPRQVQTGWRLREDVEIVKGLLPGERIVISGTFLIDSESRMRKAGAGDAPAREGPGQPGRSSPVR